MIRFRNKHKNLVDNNVVVKLYQVMKKYATGTIALDYVDLEISRGEFVFIVGSSGSGKSTLLKLILKEQNPTEGNIYVNSYNVKSLSKKNIPFFRRKIGVVFQDFRLLPKKTVYGNVELAMRAVEASPRQIRRQVPLILALTGLSKKANQYPSELSGGEQQKVAIARALINNPLLLIADEPTGNLDPNTSWDIIKQLEEINCRGTTVIVATHDIGIVNAMNKRVITIEAGRIVRDQLPNSYPPNKYQSSQNST